jgi:hypothetical protein
VHQNDYSTRPHNERTGAQKLEKGAVSFEAVTDFAKSLSTREGE